MIVSLSIHPEEDINRRYDIFAAEYDTERRFHRYLASPYEVLGTDKPEIPHVRYCEIIPCQSFNINKLQPSKSQQHRTWMHIVHLRSLGLTLPQHASSHAIPRTVSSIKLCYLLMTRLSDWGQNVHKKMIEKSSESTYSMLVSYFSHSEASHISTGKVMLLVPRSRRS